MEFFDSHAHYNDEKFEQDRDELIKKIYDEGVTRIINAGYSLESSKEAIKIAQAKDFVENMDDKYDSHIASGGSNVSGGQKQRLAIARALLKNSKILL